MLLVRFIEKRQHQPIYTDFVDRLGIESEVLLPGTTGPDGFEKFRAKARQFLKAHESHVAIQRLRRNLPTELEAILKDHRPWEEPLSAVADLARYDVAES